jgi:ABC-type transporter Mla subunit MlaD
VGQFSKNITEALDQPRGVLKDVQSRLQRVDTALGQLSQASGVGSQLANDVRELDRTADALRRVVQAIPPIPHPVAGPIVTGIKAAVMGTLQALNVALTSLKQGTMALDASLSGLNRTTDSTQQVLGKLRDPLKRTQGALVQVDNAARESPEILDQLTGEEQAKVLGAFHELGQGTGSVKANLAPLDEALKRLEPASREVQKALAGVKQHAQSVRNLKSRLSSLSSTVSRVAREIDRLLAALGPVADVLRSIDTAITWAMEKTGILSLLRSLGEEVQRGLQPLISSLLNFAQVADPLAMTTQALQEPLAYLGRDLEGLQGNALALTAVIGVVKKAAAGQRRLYRGMKTQESGGKRKPNIGPNNNTGEPVGAAGKSLWARPGADVIVGPDGMVDVLHPDKGKPQGLSVSPDTWRTLLPHRRPRTFGGTTNPQDHDMFVIKQGDVERGGQLGFNQDKPTHGTIHPADRMSIEDYERALLATREAWKVVPAPANSSQLMEEAEVNRKKEKEARKRKKKRR